jgi:hypothetical protein
MDLLGSSPTASPQKGISPADLDELFEATAGESMRHHPTGTQQGPALLSSPSEDLEELLFSSPPLPPPPTEAQQSSILPQEHMKTSEFTLMSPGAVAIRRRVIHHDALVITISPPQTHPAALPLRQPYLEPQKWRRGEVSYWE